MKKQIALLIGATFAGVALAQTPVPPVQTPRATTPPVEVKPAASASTTTKADVKTDKAAAGAVVKTEKDARTKTPKKPKGANEVVKSDGKGAVKGEIKAEAKADAKVDTKKGDKKP